MSTSIKAGVILTTKFVTNSSKKFSEYIDYMDRDEAIRNDNFYKFSAYNDYMSDTEKTSALFTESSNGLNNSQVKEFKKLFSVAQDNHSVMWQNVISFDNRWLEQNGVINKKDNTINEDILKDATRIAMAKFLANENLGDSSIWSASIHFNTKHLHIHIAVVEPFPTRERGKIKQSSFWKAKSSVVNHILDYEETHKELNSVIRDKFVQSKKHLPYVRNKEFEKLFLQTYKVLPKHDMKNFNYKSLNQHHMYLDDLTNMFLEQTFSEDFKKLKDDLHKIDVAYSQAYGKSSTSYYDTKMQDMYSRMGNTILNEMKEFHKERVSKQFVPTTSNNSMLLNKTIHFIKKHMTTNYGSYKNQMMYQQMMEDSIDNVK